MEAKVEFNKTKSIKPNYKRYILNTICSVIFVIVLSLLTKTLSLKLIIPQMIIFSIAALSLNIVCGGLGEMVLGHGGFMLVGGIVASYVSQKIYQVVMHTNNYTASQMREIFYNVGTGQVHFAGYILVIFAVIIGAIFTGIIGYLIGLAVLGRMKGDYLAIITLGIGLVFVSIANNLQTIDGFKYGVDGPSYYTSIAGNTPIFASFLIITLVCFIMIFKSRHGRAILAIREDEIAAEASGIPVKKYKIFTFTLSAIFAGLAGGLYYHFASFLGTSLFSQDRSIELLVFIVLGGLGSFTGTLLSTALLTFISYKLLLNAPGGYQLLIYGIILIVVMLIRPEGLLGTKELTWDTLRKLFHKKTKSKIRIEKDEGNDAG